jgi:hypothetical protein
VYSGCANTGGKFNVIVDDEGHLVALAQALELTGHFQLPAGISRFIPKLQQARATSQHSFALSQQSPRLPVTWRGDCIQSVWTAVFHGRHCFIWRGCMAHYAGFFSSQGLNE